MITAKNTVVDALHQIDSWRAKGTDYAAKQLNDAAMYAAKTYMEVRKDLRQLKDMTVDACTKFEKTYLSPLTDMSDKAMGIAGSIVDTDKSWADTGREVDELVADVNRYTEPAQKAVRETAQGSVILAREGVSRAKQGIDDACQAVKQAAEDVKTAVHETKTGAEIIAQEQLVQAAKKLNQAYDAAKQEVGDIRDAGIARVVKLDTEYVVPLERMAGKTGKIVTSLADGRKSWADRGKMADEVLLEASKYASKIGRNVGESASAAKQNVVDTAKLGSAFLENLKHYYRLW